MSDQESSSSSSSSQTEGELEGDGEKDKLRGDGTTTTTTTTGGSEVSTLQAVLRIKQKYQALKRRRQGMNQALGGAESFTGARTRTSPKIFTFSEEGVTAWKKKRKSKVLFPNRRGRRASPKQETSRTKHCLYLLSFIVFLQVYNAIENLDDHVLRYDLEGLEKTLSREVFGQQGAVEELLSHLKDYLSTYVHNKPLVLSMHGPTGVGKSHMGRLLAGHFRSVVGEPLVLQYYVLHHCPQEANVLRCSHNLSMHIAQMVERAEEEEKIPLFIFDEVEHMQEEILDMLWQLVATKQSNEYLNAIYLFLSNLGHTHVTRHMLHNSSSSSTTAMGNYGQNTMVKELIPILRNTLEKLHPLWTEVAILPLGLLDKGHVMECFLEEMTREGFYPDQTNIERLTGEIEYYPAVGGHQYSQTGCKQVVAKVNLL